MYIHSLPYYIIIVTCVELTNTTTTLLQYSDNVEGSLLIISCVEGYHLAGGDMMISSMCTNGSWSPNPLNILCVPEGNDFHHVYHTHIIINFVLSFLGISTNGNSKDSGLTTTVIIGVVCSLLFLIVGVVLGVMSVYLILRVRGKLSVDSRPTFPFPSPLPLPAIYEEVDVTGETSYDIQLTSNESYTSIRNLQKKKIQTLPNAACGQVQM